MVWGIGNQTITFYGTTEYIVSEAIQVYHNKLVELWDDAL